MVQDLHLAQVLLLYCTEKDHGQLNVFNEPELVRSVVCFDLQEFSFADLHLAVVLSLFSAFLYNQQMTLEWFLYSA